MCPYRDCVPPVDHELNLTTQAILTYGSWALTAVILALAIWMKMRERTAFYARGLRCAQSCTASRWKPNTSDNTRVAAASRVGISTHTMVSGWSDSDSMSPISHRSTPSGRTASTSIQAPHHRSAVNLCTAVRPDPADSSMLRHPSRHGLTRLDRPGRPPRHRYR